MDDSPRPGCLIVSSPDLLLSFRRLEFLQHLLEVALGLVVFGSIAAALLVRVPGDAGALGGALITTLIALTRALVIGGIRQRTGAHVVAAHGSGRWLAIRPGEGDRALGWWVDLRQAALPPGPLLLPGLALVASTLVPTLVRPWLPAADPLAPASIRYPTLFVAGLVLVHQATAAAVAHRPARRRFRLALPWLLLAVAILALVPLAMGAPLASPLARLPWPFPWPGAVWLLLGAWVVYAALAAVQRDALVFATLAGLLALGTLGAGSPSPHVWASFAVVSALAPAVRDPELGPAPPAPAA